jgi:hypothetical protein
MFTWLFTTLAGKIVSGVVVSAIIGGSAYIYKRYKDWRLQNLKAKVKTLQYNQAVAKLEEEAQADAEAPIDNKSMFDELDKP